MCPKRYPWISPTREAIDSIRKGFVHLPPGGHLELNRSRWIYARRCSRKHASLIFFNSLTRSPHRTTRPLRTPATPPLVRIFTSVFTPHLQVTTRGVNVMQRPSRSLSLSLSLFFLVSLRSYLSTRIRRCAYRTNSHTNSRTNLPMIRIRIRMHQTVHHALVPTRTRPCIPFVHCMNTIRGNTCALCTYTCTG